MNNEENKDEKESENHESKQYVTKKLKEIEHKMIKSYEDFENLIDTKRLSQEFYKDFSKMVLNDYEKYYIIRETRDQAYSLAFEVVDNLVSGIGCIICLVVSWLVLIRY